MKSINLLRLIVFEPWWLPHHYLIMSCPGINPGSSPQNQNFPNFKPAVAEKLFIISPGVFIISSPVTQR